MRDASVPLPLVAAGDPHGQHGRTAQRRCGVGRLGRREAAVAEARGRADNAGPNRAHDDIEAVGRRPREGRRRCHGLDFAAEAGADRHRRGKQIPRAQRAHRVRETDRKRTTGDLDVGNAQAGQGRAGRRDLAVQ